MKVKICGVTTVSDAQMVARAGADLIGINLWPRSKRHISAPRGADFVDAAREINPEIELVGVVVNQSSYEIEHFIDGLELDYIQLHGDESAATVGRYEDVAIKAIALGSDDDVHRAGDYPCDIVLVDTPSAGYGGSGRVADWSRAAQVVATSGKSVILAGGLTADNVAEAIAAVGPWGVDVASGVERSPGIKDADKVRAFIERAKGPR